MWSVFQDIDLIDILWRQDIDLGAGREIFDYSHRQKESEVDKELSDGRERGDSWRSGGNEVLDRTLLVDGETGESFPAQVTPLGQPGWGLCPGRCSLPGLSAPSLVVWASGVAFDIQQGSAERQDQARPKAASRIWCWEWQAAAARWAGQGSRRLGRGRLVLAVPLGCQAEAVARGGAEASHAVGEARREQRQQAPVPRCARGAVLTLSGAGGCSL